MTHEEIEEIAQTAATLYGQVWAGLPKWSQEIWREAVRQPHAQVQTDMERCVVKATRAWIEKQQEPQAEPESEPEEAKPVEKKSRRKKGDD